MGLDGIIKNARMRQRRETVKKIEELKQSRGQEGSINQIPDDLSSDEDAGLLDGSNMMDQSFDLFALEHTRKSNNMGSITSANFIKKNPRKSRDDQRESKDAFKIKYYTPMISENYNN